MRAFRSLFALLVGAQVGYSFLPPRHLTAATRSIVALMLAVAGAEAAQARGPRRGTALLAAAGATGFAAELAGVATGRPFGHYSYSDKLGPRVAGVPLLAGAAWALMARPAWTVAGLIDSRPAARVPLAAAALTAWDVFLDPRMVREGYWSWPGGGRYEGVPASNFLGWLGTALVVFAPWAALEPSHGHPGGATRDDGALALYTWTWIGETVANVAVWRRPRVAVAGGMAMGLFALPALAARLGGQRPRGTRRRR
jgi:putative membrane protein